MPQLPYDVKLLDRVGKVHDVSYDAIEVPVDRLREGRNEFFIFSTTSSLEMSPGQRSIARFTISTVCRVESPSARHVSAASSTPEKSVMVVQMTAGASSSATHGM